MPSSSASSLRMAASCWRSRNSRCCFSMPSLTSLLIVSATSSSARCSRAQPISSSSRRVGSMVSSSWRFCSKLEVAGVPGAVGQLRRIGDPLQHVDVLPRAALLQDRRRQAAVLAGQLGRPAGRARAPRSGCPRPIVRSRGRPCRCRCAPARYRARRRRARRSAACRPARSWRACRWRSNCRRGAGRAGPEPSRRRPPPSRRAARPRSPSAPRWRICQAGRPCSAAPPRRLAAAPAAKASGPSKNHFPCSVR